ncbi:hypothetical protein ABZS86_34365 [Streptomyces sp. NPDC005355]|uniref:hypothetical protein n=1 Tax=Streptomyces sp. NPDC005355 TaxID=3157038 RepID=UPI0033A931AD
MALLGHRAHLVHDERFKAAMETMADAVAATPQIVNAEVPGQGWNAMAELSPRHPSSD